MMSWLLAITDDYILVPEFILKTICVEVLFFIHVLHRKSVKIITVIKEHNLLKYK